MPYDQLLAGRVRRALEGRTDVVEKTMFGGVTFMVSGNMCCGVNRNDLVIRLDPRTGLDELKSPHARQWDFMPSRPMPGMFAISGVGSADQKAVEQWVALALKHASSLPAKVLGNKSMPASKRKPSSPRDRSKRPSG